MDEKENNKSGASTRDGSQQPKKRRKVAAMEKENKEVREEERSKAENAKLSFNVDEFFDFSNENPFTLEWVSMFQQLDDCLCELSSS